LNRLANRFFGDTSGLFSIFENLKSHTDCADHIHFIQCHTLINGCATVSFIFLNRLHQVHHNVSATHSIAIKGDAINDAGALHSFWYRFQFVNALCTASFILDAVFHIHSMGLRTQYTAVFVASETVYNQVQTVERGTTQTVFHNLFHKFFRNHMFSDVEFK